MVEMGVPRRLDLRCRRTANLGELMFSLSQCTEAWIHRAEVMRLTLPAPQLALSDSPMPLQGCGGLMFVQIIQDPSQVRVLRAVLSPVFISE